VCKGTDLKTITAIKGLDKDLAEKALKRLGFGNYLPKKIARRKLELQFMLVVSRTEQMFLRQHLLASDLTGSDQIRKIIFIHFLAMEKAGGR
jgi:hypothetical protein